MFERFCFKISSSMQIHQQIEGFGVLHAKSNTTKINFQPYLDHMKNLKGSLVVTKLVQVWFAIMVCVSM